MCAADNNKEAAELEQEGDKPSSEKDDQALDLISAFFSPLEGRKHLFLLTDHRTKAQFIECHVRGSKIVELGTVDVPLDPEEQGEYRANREIVESASAFQQMKEDATLGRSFSNIVTEFTQEFDEAHPLKVIGGQHRFEAIKLAVEQGVDEWHGLKIYVNLSMDQRLDVQLISNTNIAISSDLFDRMQETVGGPQLRDWCVDVGLLSKGQDFADRRSRGGTITVQVARTFIKNFFAGTEVDAQKFDSTDTSPVVSSRGSIDDDWAKLKSRKPSIWADQSLREAGKEFAKLLSAQRNAFVGKPDKVAADVPEKALNMALLSAWAYIAGVLKGNEARLKRHFALAATKGKDPLNAAALAKGRHKSDPENYRGLGYRTDSKERGRFAELFFLQAEDGLGLTSSKIDVAIKKYHAKQANLEVEMAKAKGEKLG